MLERFRNQYASHQAVHPRVRLYALIDCSAMSSIWQRQLSDTLKAVPRFPLYSESGLDDLAESGPFLIACPEPEGVEPRALCNSLNGLAQSEAGWKKWKPTFRKIEEWRHT